MANKAPCMNAPNILKTAQETLEQRGRDYDSEGGERSIAATVAAFNAIHGTGENDVC